MVRIQHKMKQLFRKVRKKLYVCAGLYCYCGGRGFVFSPVVGVGDLGALELPPPNQTPHHRPVHIKIPSGWKRALT